MREVFSLLGFMVTVCGLGVITPALLVYEAAVRVGVSDTHAQMMALGVGLLLIGIFTRFIWR